MKVVHVCNLFLPAEHPGYGRLDVHPGRWVLNHAVAQKRHTSIEPEILVQLPGGGEDFETVIEGVPVHYMAAPNRLRAATFFFFDVRRIVARLRSLKPDFVHAHGTEDAYGLAAQKSGFPYVITAQGLFFLISREVPPGLFDRRRVQQFTERRCLRRCREIIAKSEYVANELRREHPHLKIHSIPNTFDPGLLDVEGEKEKGLIVFVGRFETRKGLHLIAEALKAVRMKHPEVRLVTFGDREQTEDRYENEQKNRLRDVMGENVTFCGTRPALEVAAEVARAEALVAPSLEEMFGNQVIEALLTRTHVVVTEGTAMAENARRFGNGTIVPQNDPRSLAGALEAVLRGEISGDAEEARRGVDSEFGPERVAKAHLAVYEEILSR